MAYFAFVKDDFLLPNIDILVNATASDSIFSFMDGFSAIIKPRWIPLMLRRLILELIWVIFYYTIMSFDLMNVGAIYQRAMTTIFHDMLHCCLEDYVDDTVVSQRNL